LKIIIRTCVAAAEWFFFWVIIIFLVVGGTYTAVDIVKGCVRHPRSNQNVKGL